MIIIKSLCQNIYILDKPSGHEIEKQDSVKSSMGDEADNENDNKS